MNVRIDQRALMKQLEVAEPILVKEAEKIIRQQVFNPAVDKMKQDFEAHPVTQELEQGSFGNNLSKTLDGNFRQPAEHRSKRTKDNTPANLFSFIGFDEGSDPLEPIRDRLDPDHEDKEGPSIKYIGKDKGNLRFKFEIKAPDEKAIYDNTPLPWTDHGNISWAQRIEQGIPGVGHFLNRRGIEQSKSGGGIQVDGQLRSARFNNRSYLTQIFKDFISFVKKSSVKS